MTTNLRLSLSILSVGFAIEGSAELYAFLSKGAYRPGANVLFVLPFAMTVLGLLFVWVGRHEWNALHRSRVRQAHLVFGLSLVGALVAGTVVGALTLEPAAGAPVWAEGLFGAGVGSLVLGAFLTYALLVFHLVPGPSKALLLASLVWALIVAVFVGGAMAVNLPSILELATQRTLTVPSLFRPVDALASYLFVSYFLLLAAYVDAHRTILNGVPEGRVRPPAGIPGRLPPPSP